MTSQSDKEIDYFFSFGVNRGRFHEKTNLCRRRWESFLKCNKIQLHYHLIYLQRFMIESI